MSGKCLGSLEKVWVLHIMEVHVSVVKHIHAIRLSKTGLCLTWDQ